MKTLLILVNVIISQTLLNGQIGQYYFGDKNDELILSSEKINDTTFLLARQIENYIFLTKVNHKLNILWDIKISFDSSATSKEIPSKIKIIDDKVFLVGRSQYGTSYPEQYAFVMIFDLDGRLIKKKRYYNISVISDIIKINTSSFGIVGLEDLLGSQTSGVVGILDSNLVLINKVSKIVYGNCWYKKIFLTRSGNITVIARTNSIGSGFDGLLIEDYDVNLKLNWRKFINLDFRELDAYAMARFEHPIAANYLEDGSIILFEASHWVNSLFSSITEIVVSDSGEIIKSKDYYLDYSLECPNDICLFPGGRIGIIGNISSRGIDENLPTGKSFFLLLDSSGSKINLSYFGQTDSTTVLLSIWPIEYGIIAFGFANSNVSDNKLDNYAIIADQLGNIHSNTANIGVVIDANRNCTFDTNEVYSGEYIINIEGIENFSQYSSKEGMLKFILPDGNYKIRIKPRELSNSWIQCDTVFDISLSKLNRKVNFNFLIEPQIEKCNRLNLGLAQPDLVRCSNSDILLSISNKNLNKSTPFFIDFRLEEGLELLDASTSYKKENDKFRLLIGEIDELSSKNINIQCKVDCKVQLGATHMFQLDIIDPNQCKDTVKPIIQVDSYCSGNEVIFNYYNRASENSSYSLDYNVYFNQFLAYSSENSSKIRVKSNSEISELRFPANGGTWRLEILDNSGTSQNIVACSAIEDCGFTNSKTHQIGFRNDRQLCNNEFREEVMISNSTGSKNAITGSFEGLGAYHLIDRLGQHEFNIRFANSSLNKSKKVVIDLFFTTNYDLSTFVPTVYCCNFELKKAGANRIIITFNKMDFIDLIDTNDIFNFKFSIWPFLSTLPDQSNESYFSIRPTYFLDDEGPFSITPSYYNYSILVDQKLDSAKLYANNIYELFSEGYNVGRDLMILDSTIYVSGISNSFNHSNNIDVLWYSITTKGAITEIDNLDQISGESTYFQGAKISLLKYVFCIILDNKKLVLNKYSLSGKIIWSKTYSPGPNNELCNTARLITDDTNGDLYIGGNLYATNSYIYLMRLDSLGNIVYRKSFNNTDYVQSIIRNNSNKIIFGTFNFNSFPVFNQPYTYTYDLSNGNWNRLLINTNSFDNYISDLFSAEQEYVIQPGECAIDIDTIKYRYVPTIAKYNANGKLVYFKKLFLDSLWFASFSSGVYDSKSNSYYFVGQNSLPGQSNHDMDILLCKTDLDGKPIWWKSFGNKNSEDGQSILILDDLLVILARSSESEPAYRDQPLLIFSDIDGNAVNILKDISSSSNYQINISPNPATNSLRVNLNVKSEIEFKFGSKWYIINNSGHILLTGLCIDQSFEINIGALPSGNYHFMLPKMGQSVSFVKL